MPGFVRVDGRLVRKVKNLGWLRRHWQEVQEFTATKQGSGGGLLTARMRDGKTVYTIGWSSFRLLLEWLNRPIFKGLPVYLGSLPEFVGKPPLEIGCEQYVELCRGL